MEFITHSRTVSYPSLIEEFVSRFNHERMIFPLAHDGVVEGHFRLAEVTCYAASQLRSGALVLTSLLEGGTAPWQEGNVETLISLMLQGFRARSELPRPAQLAEPWHRTFASLAGIISEFGDLMVKAHYFTALTLLIAYAWGRPELDQPSREELSWIVENIVAAHRRLCHPMRPISFSALARPEQFVARFDAQVMAINLPPRSGWVASDPYLAYIESLAQLKPPDELAQPLDGKLLGWPLGVEDYLEQVMLVLEQAVHIPVWVLMGSERGMLEKLRRQAERLGRTASLYHVDNHPPMLMVPERAVLVVS